MTLLTKYRPQELDEMIGQDAVIGSVDGAIRKKTSRCFLLSGPSGCGKTTLAYIMARIAGSKESDIQYVNAAKFTGVDDMREITNSLLYQPFGQSTVKTLLVDECHMLSKAAWNSLLESTENPPDWLLWIFCTTEPAKVLPTIQTRCVKYQLKAVNSTLLFDLVKFIATKEKLEAAKSEGVLELCVREAYGSPRQAIANLVACADTSDRKVAAELLKSAADSPDAVELARMFLDGGSWDQAIRIINKIKEQDPESIRQTIKNYLTAVVMNSKSEDKAGKTIEILSKFNQPFLRENGITSVLIATARVLLA